MGNPARIVGAISSAPSGPVVTGRPPPELPPDLLRQASRRLGIVALSAAALSIVAQTAAHVAWPLIQGSRAPWVLGTGDIVGPAIVVVSLALFLYLRHERDPAFVVNLGLAYMVALTFAIGVAFHWGGPSDDSPFYVVPTITWAGPVILMFAGALPASPAKMAVAGILAASMDPIAMLVGKATAGIYTFGALADALLMHYQNYIMVAIAVMISSVMTRLGQQVSKARDMGSYHLGELIGQGGMGEVYRATHRMLARPAAIKLIRPQRTRAGDSESARLVIRRFHREAEVAASLRSPHTVELYDFGITEDQTLYFVMELLEGLDLETLVRQHGPLPAARVVRILVQTCESLEEAHQRGLVHRDIKPANIHVGRLGVQNDFVKVLDFGLVKSIPGSSGESSLVTIAGEISGTPAYMAPEVAMGETFDGRADLYALGCVAYYLLTGQRVFEGTTSLQLIAQHLHSVPIPPSKRCGIDIPPELDQLVLACLAKKPAQRPCTALELSRRITAVRLEVPWTDERAAEWWGVNQQ
jgi:tRNA A-37 threonylcarbamoyl transferase component Bud32